MNESSTPRQEYPSYQSNGCDVLPAGEPAFACPTPHGDEGVIEIAHGGGGRKMHRLLETVFAPLMANGDVEQHDGYVFPANFRRMATTTDSYVVRPRFFAGGDIGSMAVNGTVNDLAMCGARPLYMSAGFILEEGLPLRELEHIVASMARAARQAEVRIVTGDTKVVERGRGDGVYINTAGVGGIIESEYEIESDMPDNGGRARTTRGIGPRAIQAGDAILLSGDIGRHAAAVMAAREGIDCDIASDCAPLHRPVLALLEAGLEVHCLRDITRGGLATGLVELARSSGLHLNIEEARIPVTAAVRALCEILGLDPLYLANEGRFVTFLPAEQADTALRILRSFPETCEAAVILGEARSPANQNRAGMLTMTGRLGADRIVDMLSGEQLPRIC